MPSIYENARITVAGHTVTGRETIQQRAWLLYMAAATEISKRNSEACIKDDIPGRLVKNFSMQRVLLDLWPEYSASQLSETLKGFAAPIYGLLRATKNAIAGPAGSWWIADSFQPIQGLQLDTPGEPTRADKNEARVTATEAGEDRTPGDVIIRHPKGSGTGVGKGHGVKQWTPATMATAIREALGTTGNKPMTRSAIATAAGVNTDHSTFTRTFSVMTSMGELVQSGTRRGRNSRWALAADVARPVVQSQSQSQQKVVVQRRRRPNRRAEVQAQILEALEGEKEGLLTREIGDLIGESNASGTLHSALDALYTKGIVGYQSGPTSRQGSKTRARWYIVEERKKKIVTALPEPESVSRPSETPTGKGLSLLEGFIQQEIARQMEPMTRKLEAIRQILDGE